MPTATQKPEVLYKKSFSRLYSEEKPLTVTQAKKFMGWTEVENGQDYLLKDLAGKKIRCTNNLGNRPFTRSNADFIKQEILRKRWQLNGNTRIIGRTGKIISAQHTLIGLILAAQEWEQHPEKFSWKTEPTIATYVVFGIQESDDVVNTVDTGKPRTLDEVIFRSGYFSEFDRRERKRISRVLSYAVKFVWNRLGVKNAFSIRRTHSESLDFIARHPKLVECVEHIYTENSDDSNNNQIKWYTSLGHASGLLYLMGCSKTEPGVYHQDENPREELLDWKMWDQACEFWVLLANTSSEITSVRNALLKLQKNDRSTLPSQCAVLVKAWNLYTLAQEIMDGDLELQYEKNQDGFQELAECPTIGGIDVGDGEDNERATAGDPTPDEILQRAKTVRENGVEPVESVSAEPHKPRQKGKSSKLLGKTMWVKDPVEPWKGKVTKVTGKTVELTTLQGFQGAGNTRSTTILNLQKAQPEPLQ